MPLKTDSAVTPRTHASFELDVPSLAAPGATGAARAEPLAEALLAALERDGFPVVRLGGLAYAADFRVRSGAHAFYGMVGPVDDGPRQWLVTFDSSLPVWRRWFGATDARELEAVLRAVHATLSAFPGIRTLRWYTPRDWNEAPDERWHPEPGA